MYLLLDIGGTNIRIAVAKDAEHLLQVVAIPTPSSFSEALEKIANVASSLSKGEALVAVAAGVRALDLHTGKMRQHSHVHLWEGESVLEGLRTTFGVPVYLENDAALAALGEATYGAGKGKKIVCYLTLSTGLGGARVTDGVLDKVAEGFEPGNQIIADVNGQITRLYERVDGASLVKRYGIPAKDITDAAVWNSVADDFAIGIVNTIVHWSPDILIIGGSIGLSEKLPFDRLVKRVMALHTVFPVPEIVRATLVDEAGLYGALAYLQTVGAAV